MKRATHRRDRCRRARTATLRLIWLSAAVACSGASHAAAAEGAYYPGKWDEWETRAPQDVGMDPALLDKAVAFSKAHESTQPRNLDLAIRQSISGQTYDELIGPTKPRGATNGLILRHGYIVAEWGDTRRVDMTFSATKSYLATTAGLAWDKGLIRKLDDPARMYVPGKTFASKHNRAITWHMLLNQTSEWEGTLWGKPDWAPVWNGTMRDLHTPGTHWQYNDVRVNCLALALLHVWREPLPRVLKRQIMDPIDASPTWRWYGYRNSWVNVDGVRVQSVSGGGHWGGGLQISTRDHARFGYLFLRRGRWKDRQLISEKWIDLMTTPTDVKPDYGYMWWLNTGKQRNPDVPQTCFSAVGAGTNLVWIDPDHDLVAVVRWIDPAQDQQFISLVAAAVKH
jgi:CubicO group peptidase (beta-lactamase class C family)